MRGAVAILGWGSLLWDLDDLAPKVRGDWALGGGPALPLEFSRVSPKRLMSLVVVIDPAHGTDCPTHAIASRRESVAEAAEDLRARERAADIRFIGAFCRETGFARSAHPVITERVAAWCAETGARGVVWTDLPANFEAETGRPFSVPACLAYLRGLKGASAAEARSYIDSAPATTDTALRRTVATQGWWRAPQAGQARR
jgi:hypothetical protein